MMTLWIIFAAMLVLASLILLWPLVSYKGVQNGQSQISQKQKNINIFQERLSELDSEKAQGNLDELTFQQLKTELEKTLLGDVQFEDAPASKVAKVNAQSWLVMGLVSAILILGSLSTYNTLGASEQYRQYLALADQPAANTPETSGSSKPTAPDFAAAVSALKAKLAENPEDIEKWFLLANSYAAMGDYSQAAAVYKKMSGIIGEQNPGYASAQAAYAQMAFQVAGEKVTPDVQQAMDEALRVDPEEPTALILQGLQAYQKQAYPEAIAAWEKAKIKGGQAQIKRFIEPAIQEARRQSGIVAPVQTVQKSTAAAVASVTVKLDISPVFKVKLSPEARVFVFAKAGMPMPLAAERLQVKDLPITLVLDDSKAAMPTAKISSAEFVDITARVALSGSPRAVKGDLYATAKHVAVRKGSVITLVIDQLVE